MSPSYLGIYPGSNWEIHYTQTTTESISSKLGYAIVFASNNIKHQKILFTGDKEYAFKEIYNLLSFSPSRLIVDFSPLDYNFICVLSVNWWTVGKEQIKALAIDQSGEAIVYKENR